MFHQREVALPRGPEVGGPEQFGGRTAEGERARPVREVPARGLQNERREIKTGLGVLH